ncbi:DUF512 domain-containing protein [Acutalibacter sp. 1XD8-33]|uniref:DUF512 domain-containing protein n=1 Tax=Acutalibacter sp. 1XD8-33 TaxID=2320081 RepID=UPI000EA3BA0A|nr:DUF512 domain-containing protein [Acutalibacter sp. 1XD8-33]RKJ39015.1 DUF512 domain-containing protein [Acutalibacter sp. 1XD8-33]
MVRIDGVEAGSRAQRAGILPGDLLVSINGHPVGDVLDYRFYETERELRLDLRRGEEDFQVELAKPRYAALGLEFESYLMDRQRSCRNKCVFCFIDQLPKGMRETLYFKDDDDRLSFLFGNYITLTNIDDREIDRILQMHISPINISVHTMDPELRCRMMNNRFAGESLRHLYRLAEGGIRLNCQIVLCPGLNDGSALEYSLSELCKLGEGLQSVACVPVGLTRYREGLYPLTPFDRESALAALAVIEKWGEACKGESGARRVYASDELYLLAGRELPPAEFYEDFPQIENGVGMLRDLEEGFRWALEDLCEEDLPAAPRKVTIPTGECAWSFLNKMLDELRNRCHNLKIELVPVPNDFFGGTVNVTGLLTGQDICARLTGRDLGDQILIAGNMLKAGEDIFLDDMTLSELSERLGTPALRVGGSGEDLLMAILGREQPGGAGHNPYEAERA